MHVLYSGSPSLPHIQIIPGVVIMLFLFKLRQNEFFDFPTVFNEE